MTLPDINLLTHAHNHALPRYEAARAWWDQCLGGTEGIGLAWVVILGFIRISTHRAILSNPMSPSDACSRVEEWLSLPHLHITVPAKSHFTRLSAALEHLGTAGNLSTDAHLATLAIERGYVLHSTDADFARFPGLKWRNPIG